MEALVGLRLRQLGKLNRRMKRANTVTDKHGLLILKPLCTAPRGGIAVNRPP